MPREKVQLVEIPLFQGISRDRSPLDRGASLATAQNVVPNYQDDEAAGTFTRSPYPDASPTLAITAVGKTGDTNLYLMGLGRYDYSSASASTPGCVAFGLYERSGLNYLGLWSVPAGEALHGALAAGEYRLDTSIGQDTWPQNLAACWAFVPWESTYGRIYYSHEGAHASVTGIMKYDTVSGVAKYTAHLSAIGTNLRATALAEHLDRLWIACPVETTYIRTTRIAYSDPFDTATVRAENIIKVHDTVRAMFRPTASDVDATVQPHLVIGCRNSIWVFDGDPSYGNTAFRLLTDSVGIAAQTLVQETSDGALFVGTDGQVYAIPAGATQIVPIGGPVRALLWTAVNRQWLPAIPETAAGTLIWKRPYLTYWSGDTGTLPVTIDLGTVSAATWWGPHSSPTSLTGTVVLRGAQLARARNRAIETVYMAGAYGSGGLGGSLEMMVYAVTQDANSVDTPLAASRPVQFVSNPIWVPDHDVLIRRVIVHLRPTTTAATYDLSVTVTGDTAASAVTRTQAAPIDDASQTIDRVRKLVYAFDTQAVRASKLIVTVATAANVLPDLHKVFAEVWIVPRAD